MKPDFEKAYRFANEAILLASHSISSFPADIKSFIQNETDIVLCSYKYAMKNWHLDISSFGSEDALLCEKKGRYILFYNSGTSKQRLRWSLTHELGHFYLGHTLSERELDEETYDKQEVEAHFFAAQVLMPDQVIHELVLRGERLSTSLLAKWFQVSIQAARKRMQTINRQGNFLDFKPGIDYSQEVLLKFAPFIDSIKPKYEAGSTYIDLYEDEKQKDRDSWMYDWH